MPLFFIRMRNSGTTPSRSPYSFLFSQIPKIDTKKNLSSLISQATPKNQHNLQIFCKAVLAAGVFSAVLLSILDTKNTSKKKALQDTNKIKLSPRTFIDFCQALGYQSIGGLCLGGAFKGLEAILLGNKGIEDFDCRLEKITQLSENIKEINPSQEFFKKNDSSYADIIGFLDGVQLYSRAYKYSQLFEKERYSRIISQTHLEYIQEVSLLTSSTELEAAGGIFKLDDFTGVYDKIEMDNYLSSLKKVLENNPQYKERLGLYLSSINHAISIGYDPIEKTWIFINFNKIEIRKTKDRSVMSGWIMGAFDNQSEGKITLFTSVYSTRNSKDSSLKISNEWKKSSEFKKIHEITPEKIQLTTNAFNTINVSLLLVAAHYGDAKTVKVLLAGGADPNQTASNGGTALLTASQCGHIEVIKLLLEYGVDIHQAHLKGTTPLLIACANGRTEAVKLLLKAGANKDQTNEDGVSPLLAAHESGYTEIVELLSK